MSLRKLAWTLPTKLRPNFQPPTFSIHTRLNSTHHGVIQDVRGIMRKVPQPVVVVTTSKPDDIHDRRGITVSSFTSVSLQPDPLVSFCVRIPSRASELLHSSGNMVLNMLSHEQVQQSIAFSSPTSDQFKDIPFFDDPITGLPVLMGTVGAMHCQLFKVIELGDHELWIAKVLKVEQGVGGEHGKREEANPLLYYERAYRSIGDQVFMKAFEDDCEGSFNAIKWMHRAHLRMAWNYIRELGSDAAEPKIKQTLRSHFKRNPKKSQDYHETITSFYIALVSAAIRSYKGSEESDFFELVEKFPQLLDTKTIEKYYSADKLYTDEARHVFVLPDIQPLPTHLQ
ncbi:flavin reductase like domain-containing protein [Thamnidium elegans]|nr:flavin reductase like domain-containing protein [Thamnidium elegans]